jgi:GNAT superfamily N-acetyltransferase
MEAEVETFQSRTATSADLAAYYRVIADCQEIDNPDAPHLTYENVIGRLDSPFPGLGLAVHWIARSGNDIVGVANAHFPTEVENATLAVFDVQVRPSHRRSGIATKMLAVIAAVAHSRGRRRLELWKVIPGGPGHSWSLASGFRQVRSIVVQTLRVSEVDRTVWDVALPADYRLERWESATPEAVIETYSSARQAIHDAPLADSEFRSPQWTAEKVRQREKQLRSQGIRYRVAAAVHEPTGDIVGITETMIPPHRLNWVYQGDTAVLAAHRGRGLGFAIKAAMAEWLVTEHPELERFQSSTGTENVHMIRVNHALGFVTDLTELELSLETNHFHPGVSGPRVSVEPQIGASTSRTVPSEAKYR